MKVFKVNELFEMSQTYEYKPVSEKRSGFKNMTTYVYNFVSDDGTEYMVDIVLYSKTVLNVKTNKLKTKVFATTCFANKENYNRGKRFKWKYKLTNKHDAIKVLNTVIKIIKDFSDSHNMDEFGINTSKDRLETYKYIFNKYFKGWKVFVSIDDSYYLDTRFNIICSKETKEDNPDNFRVD